MVFRSFLRLVFSIAICYGAGYVASVFAIPRLSGWYTSLSKPGFMPPDSFLIPIGIVMYLLLGLSLYFIWSSEENRNETKICIYLYVFGLFLNVLWFFVFFGLQSLLIAFIVAIMLLGIVTALVVQSFRVAIPACILLVPYGIMCLILTILNYLIYIMNPNLPALVL